MSIRKISFFFFLVVPFALHAQWQSIGNVDSVGIGRDNDLTLRSGKALVFIKALTHEMLRVRLATNGILAPDLSYAVVKTAWPTLKVDIAQTTTEVVLSTQAIILRITKKPLRLSFADMSGNIINHDEPTKGMAWTGSEIRVWKKMPQDEYFLGFGEKAGRLQKKSQHLAMWNSDVPAYKADTDPLYQSHPFFYGMRPGKAYGIFLDNSHWSSFDMGVESPGQYSFGASDGELNYYFIYGPTPKQILGRYTELVGRMPLPPRWSLGYQQCRWSYPNEQRVREIARGFRSRNIPCDVIYLDIDYMDGYRIFTWNRNNFPSPKSMIADLKKDGFRVAVIVDPGIKADTAYAAYRTGLASNAFVKLPDGKLFIGKVWPGECAFPDFTNPAARSWWGNNFTMLVDDGVRGWWNDMNEPSVFDVPTKTIDLTALHNENGLTGTHAKIHNVYGMLMTRATFEGVKRLLPTERPFVLTRASFAGGHRYSAAWTGDNVASWEHLQMAVPMCLNLGVSGQPFVGSDIGGFIGYPSGELFARWLQLGVFTPLMRAHSVIHEKNKEPWEYGDEFTKINRETINLRYQFLPYIYSTMHNASVTGIPPMRPLLFDYPEDGNSLWNDRDFMFGDDLLIAPVLEESARKRDLHLPQGTWYDFYTGSLYEGGKDVSVDAPLNKIPVFAKAGAIVPTQQTVQFTDQAPIDPLTLTVFPAAASSTTYYEDDGTSFEYTTGRFFKRTLSLATAPSTLSVALGEAEGSYTPAPRSLVLKFMAISHAPKAVVIDGGAIKAAAGPSFDKAMAGWDYNVSAKTLLVKFPDRPGARLVTVQR